MLELNWTPLGKFIEKEMCPKLKLNTTLSNALNGPLKCCWFLITNVVGPFVFTHRSRTHRTILKNCVNLFFDDKIYEERLSIFMKYLMCFIVFNALYFIIFQDILFCGLQWCAHINAHPSTNIKIYGWMNEWMTSERKKEGERDRKRQSTRMSRIARMHPISDKHFACVCSGIKSSIIFGKLSSDRYRLSLFHCKRSQPL